MDPIKFSPPGITEEDIEAVTRVLRSGWITTGPECQAFERELAAFCGTEQAVCVSSATAALELTLCLLGIGPGDEVLVPAYTYTATASAVCHTGARLVLVDCAPGEYEMDYDTMERSITSATKAVIPVDFAGRMCDYERIYEAVRRQSGQFRPGSAVQRSLGRVAVVADAAHALGAEYHGARAGAAADFTCFSFHAVKNLTTAEGGAVTWSDRVGVSGDWIYRTLRQLSLHGQTKDALLKSKAGGWEYDILAPAYKCNLTDLQAALGRSQLRRYPRLLDGRQELAACYDALLAGTEIEPLAHRGQGWRSSAHLYPVRVPWLDENGRAAVIEQMARQNVATNVHYKPLPMLTAYRRLGFDPADFPNAYAQYQCEITLPLYPALTNEQARHVVDTLLRAVDASGRITVGDRTNSKTFHKLLGD